jgi:hypothetical protein
MDDSHGALANPTHPKAVDLGAAAPFVDTCID